MKRSFKRMTAAVAAVFALSHTQIAAAQSCLEHPTVANGTLYAVPIFASAFRSQCADALIAPLPPENLDGLAALLVEAANIKNPLLCLYKTK